MPPALNFEESSREQILGSIDYVTFRSKLPADQVNWKYLRLRANQ